MLSFLEFFATCSGQWSIERTYHYLPQQQQERSFTQYQVNQLPPDQKLQLIGAVNPDLAEASAKDQLILDRAALSPELTDLPGFAIAFQTRSETGAEVAMQLMTLFVPDRYVLGPQGIEIPPLPTAAVVDLNEPGAASGFYLRDEGYSEAGAIAGRFTYLPSRQALEMTTYYSRSVAVDQMRLLTPTTRLRTITTYQRPEPGLVPQVINLVGFGVEQKTEAA
jgi:hypothetical protein